MRKLSVIASVAALVVAPALAEIVVFEEGFGTPGAGTYCEPAFPAGWVLHDEDGGDPHSSEVTSAWVTVEDDLAAGNCVAESTSWYTPVGVADDWMVTPLIHLPEGAVLSWRARAHDENYPESYQVRYSTTGTDVASLLSHPALGAGTYLEESSLWGRRSIDLDAAGLSGRAVHLAFRNVSNDQILLYVDDVRVSVDDAIFREEFGGTTPGGVCVPEFPATWSRHDLDGNTPAEGYEWVDAAWVAAVVGEEDLSECAAFSTSSYGPPPGQADDWMVTPPIEIPIAAELRWRARANLEGFQDGYEVRVSTTGVSVPGDFATILLTVLEEAISWTDRSVDLDDAGLAGATARFAFRNPSDDLDLLAIDSVEVAQALIFRDGFNSGFTGAWSGVAGE